MERKVVVSGPVRGPLVERQDDRQPSRARPRTGLIAGRRQGTKKPPPIEGNYRAAA